MRTMVSVFTLFVAINMAMAQPCKTVLRLHKRAGFVELHANKPDTVTITLACVSGCKVLAKPVDTPGISITKISDDNSDDKSASATFLVVARQKGNYNVEVRSSCPKGKKMTFEDGTSREISGSLVYGQLMLEILE